MATTEISAGTRLSKFVFNKVKLVYSRQSKKIGYYKAMKLENPLVSLDVSDFLPNVLFLHFLS